MKHPEHESLAAWLYGDVTPPERTAIEAHLRDCGECRGQVEQWQALRRELAGWTLPATAARAEARRRAATGLALPWLRWATAAMVFAGLGFSLARWLTPPPMDAAALRAQIAGELRGEFQVEIARAAQAQAVRQEQYERALTAALGKLEARRVMDYTALRHDVETVATRAERELFNTREGLYQLAGYQPPAVEPPRPPR